jgi:hypothetical protein
MAKKLRKMLGDVNSPSAVELRNLIDTQSKDTIRKWCLEDAERTKLPLNSAVSSAFTSTVCLVLYAPLDYHGHRQYQAGYAAD